MSERHSNTSRFTCFSMRRSQGAVTADKDGHVSAETASVSLGFSESVSVCCPASLPSVPEAIAPDQWFSACVLHRLIIAPNTQLNGCQRLTRLEQSMTLTAQVPTMCQYQLEHQSIRLVVRFLTPSLYVTTQCC